MSVDQLEGSWAEGSRVLAHAPPRMQPLVMLVRKSQTFVLAALIAGSACEKERPPEPRNAPTSSTSATKTNTSTAPRGPSDAGVKPTDAGALADGGDLDADDWDAGDAGPPPEASTKAAAQILTSKLAGRMKRGELWEFYLGQTNVPFFVVDPDDLQTTCDSDPVLEHLFEGEPSRAEEGAIEMRESAWFVFEDDAGRVGIRLEGSDAALWVLPRGATCARPTRVDEFASTTEVFQGLLEARTESCQEAAVAELYDDSEDSGEIVSPKPTKLTGPWRSVRRMELRADGVHLYGKRKKEVLHVPIASARATGVGHIARLYTCDKRMVLDAEFQVFRGSVGYDDTIGKREIWELEKSGWNMVASTSYQVSGDVTGGTRESRLTFSERRDKFSIKTQAEGWSAESVRKCPKKAALPVPCASAEECGYLTESDDSTVVTWSSGRKAESRREARTRQVLWEKAECE